MIMGALLALLALGFSVAVVRFWRQIFAEAEDPPEIERSATRAVDTWECRVAVHEAGHAVAAWCCTLVPEVRVATIEHKNGGGVVTFIFLEVPGPDAAWCRAVIGLAGVVAEAAVYSKWRVGGSREDIATALEQVKLAAAHEPPWERIGVRGGSVPDLQRMFSHKLSASELSCFEECWRMARKIIRSHGGDFFRLVGALLAVKTAKETQLESVLGTRHVTRLAIFVADIEKVVRGQTSVFRPRFVLPRRGRTRKEAA
jgi:hypothetical protein